MAYGRLDIFLQDGTLKSVPLSAPVTTVGSSPQCLIVLDSRTIAAEHLRLVYEHGQASVIDSGSKHGTFIEGERLKPGVPHPVNGGDEIIAGDLRLLFYIIDSADESPTRPIVVPEETTQRFEALSSSFSIDVLSPEQGVAPGAHIPAQIIIRNLSTTSERYTVEVAGIPRDWIRVERSEVEVAPGKTEDILVNFKPARRPESTPGRYRVHFTVRRKAAPEDVLKGETVLEVLPFSGFGIALEDNRLQAGERFKLYLHNQGSSTLNLSITPRDIKQKLRFNLQSPGISLSPGQRSVVQGTVIGRGALLGSEATYPFDLLVRSRDASGFLTVVRAYATVKPTLPSWAPAVAIAGIGGLVLLALVLAVLIFSRTSAAPPVIESFTVSSSQIVRGDDLIVNWEVDRADSVTVLTNGVPRQTLDASATSSLFSTDDIPTGPVEITLRVTNGAGTTEAVQTVEIISVLRVESFSIQPQQLIRNVLQPVTINWLVSGAANTRLDIPASVQFSPPLAPAYGASNTLNVAALVTDNFTMVLTAQDAAGDRITQSLAVTVTEPRCSVTTSNAAVYAVPDGSSQVIGTLRAGVPSVVTARDNGTVWIKVTLENGREGWVARNLLTCESTFGPEQLRVENVPLPTLPPALPPTASLPQTTPLPTLPPLVTPTLTPTGRLGG
ncbi:MAG: FHA domain-containing protein [Chloroflexota bacterium]|nr:FHA domain-containing protein [Chloroflexota bacterium]